MLGAAPWATGVAASSPGSARAASMDGAGLDARIKEIVGRPEFARAEADLTGAPDLARSAAPYGRENELAEHVSPPLPEELKVMLKVSSNIHTAMWPYVIGVIATGNAEDAKAAGLELQRRLFERAGLGDTPGGGSEGRYTPESFTRFLAYMSNRPYYREHRLALPILGRDGTLTDVEPDSPAAGHVFAKTGTALGPRESPASLDKALAGFVELPDGRVLSFGVFASLPSPDMNTELAGAAGRALGEIAATVHEDLAAR